jgi:hypothetical protein
MGPPGRTCARIQRISRRTLPIALAVGGARGPTLEKNAEYFFSQENLSFPGDSRETTLRVVHWEPLERSRCQGRRTQRPRATAAMPRCAVTAPRRCRSHSCALDARPPPTAPRTARSQKTGGHGNRLSSTTQTHTQTRM